ncbi:hypothetical protein Q9L58_010288 [Maublancomyces gigas]|uniref:Uncharacterized protein n=1 Tax=Discina gigas TaxID=1032678 RepID=A0ABR3G4H9_9PEZI
MAIVLMLPTGNRKAVLKAFFHNCIMQDQKAFFECKPEVYNVGVVLGVLRYFRDNALHLAIDSFISASIVVQVFAIGGKGPHSPRARLPDLPRRVEQGAFPDNEDAAEPSMND